MVELVDNELVSFESFWKTLHHSNKSSEISKPILSAPINRLTTNQRYPPPPNINNEAPVRHLQPVLPGIVGYGSGSEYSQPPVALSKTSSMKKSSGVTIPPPPPLSTTRQPMQFISAGFKPATDLGHLTPGEQLAQFQQQEGHRIQSTGGYSINKHFRPQQ